MCWKQSGENNARRSFNLTRDIEKREQALDRIGEVVLIIIDPISAYLLGTDTHKNADVRSALAMLQELAVRRSVAVVAISHFNKSAGQGKSVNAISGSGAFVAVSRATFVVTKDNDDLERRLFLQAKNNLANAVGLSFKVVQGQTKDGIAAPFVKFEEGTISLTADEAIRVIDDETRHSAISEARMFLEMDLAHGAVLQKEVFERASAIGIAERTLRRAQKILGVKAVKSGFDGGWIWSLPDAKMANHPQDDQQKPVDIFGTIGHLRGQTQRNEIN